MAVTPLRKITHKGEVEVQEETYQDLDTNLTENTKDYNMDRNMDSTSNAVHTPGVSVRTSISNNDF